LIIEHMRSIALQVVRKPENGHDKLKLNCVQMRESGCINHYVTVLLADAKAKTVTNKLPQLTVLAHVDFVLSVKEETVMEIEFIIESIYNADLELSNYQQS